MEYKNMKCEYKCTSCGKENYIEIDDLEYQKNIKIIHKSKVYLSAICKECFNSSDWQKEKEVFIYIK